MGSYGWAVAAAFLLAAVAVLALAVSAPRASSSRPVAVPSSEDAMALLTRRTRRTGPAARLFDELLRAEQLEAGFERPVGNRFLPDDQRRIAEQARAGRAGQQRGRVGVARSGALRALDTDPEALSAQLGGPPVFDPASIPGLARFTRTQRGKAEQARVGQALRGEQPGLRQRVVRGVRLRGSPAAQEAPQGTPADGRGERAARLTAFAGADNASRPLGKTQQIDAPWAIVRRS